MKHRSRLAGETVRAIALWVGVAAVSLGVTIHLPAYGIAPQLANIPYCGGAFATHDAMLAMEPQMILGMVLIILGTLAAGYGLWPMAKAGSDQSSGRRSVELHIEGGLTRAHWELMTVLTLAVIIDVMKPATLGFVMPGMARDYGLTRAEVAYLPLVALTGTAVGSLLWGLLADRIGRRSTVVMATIMFVGTSICGAMPSFGWNLAMCFLMGMPVGGMLPIAFTLLSEVGPAKHRGWMLVLLGGFALAGGYLAASLAATLLEPAYGWRSLWLVGLPTGLLLVLLSTRIPESPAFLLRQDRRAECDAVMARYHLNFVAAPEPAQAGPANREARLSMLSSSLRARGALLNALGIVWGLVNFGLLLWLPTDLQERGIPAAGASALLAWSSLVVLPVAVAAAWAYKRYGGRRLLAGLSGLTAAGLLMLAAYAWLGQHGEAGLLPLIALVMIGSNGMIAVLLPYCAESFPTSVRGEATGYVAGSTKFGGIGAQVIGLAGLVPTVKLAAVMLAVPIAVAALVLAGTRRPNLASEQGAGM